MSNTIIVLAGFMAGLITGAAIVLVYYRAWWNGQPWPPELMERYTRVCAEVDRLRKKHGYHGVVPK